MTSPDTAHARPLRIHGGRTDAAALIYPDAPRPFLDLSTGINPVGYPAPLLDPAHWQRLTLQGELDALETAARMFYRAPANAEIVLVPGTEIGLRLLPKVMAASDVCVLGPTYSSHAESWRDNGAAVRVVSELPEIAPEVTVIVNPNNPDGRLIAPDAIRRHAAATLPLPPMRERAQAKHVIVDEAFGETAPELSVLNGEPLPDNIVVLRSIGKFFGLAGLRVGFIFCARPIAAALRGIIGAWPIGGAQALIAAAALGDARWIEATRRRLKSDSERLASLLARHGLQPVGGTSLFVLAEAQLGLEERLARQGVLIRAFDHSPGRFRFGLPANDAEFSRLDSALSRSV